MLGYKTKKHGLNEKVSRFKTLKDDNITLKDDNIKIMAIKKGELKSENNTVDAAFTKAVGSVCRAPKTKKQIEEYLHKQGFSEEVINAAVEKLSEYNFVDDAQFAQSYIDFYGKSKGKRRLKDELKQKGVSEEIVENCVELYPCQTETARAAAAKFMRNRQNDFDSLTKLYRHLAAKGFEFSVCRDVVKEISSGEIEDLESQLEN